MATTPTHALVLDLETTGSDPTASYAAILEVGAILCEYKPDLPVLAEASLVIRPPGRVGDHAQMWAQMPQVVRDMHIANGLWREATTSEEAWQLGEADTGLHQWLVQQGVEGQIPVLGSGVGHLDVPFLKLLMPRLSTKLTYWHLDIGNVRRMLELAGRADHVDIATDVDAKPHRGLDDARLHLAEARRYLQLLGQLPQLAAPEPELPPLEELARTPAPGVYGPNQ